MILGIDASQANRKIRSGTEWYAFYLIQEFKKLLGTRSDIKIRLYVRGQLQSDLAGHLPQNFQVRILRWPLRFFWGQIRLSWEIFLHPPDALFCPAHTIPFVHPKKTYTTLHDVGFEDYPELYDLLSRVYHRASAKFAIRKAAHIFTVSEFSRQRIMEVYDYPKERITVAYPAVETALFSRLGEGDDVLRDLALKAGEYFLYIGRLEPKKNILNIIKAYEFLETPWPLVLAGQKVRIEAVVEYLEERPKLAANVRFLNYITEGDKAVLLRGAAQFIFPTLYEGFGIPILEAQAAGVPVVTSNTGSNSEVAGMGALIVDPESPYEMSKAIKKITDDKALRSKLVVEGTKNLGRFSWEQSARQILEIILEKNA